ncbi:hypothetical protein BDN70DRAFT_827641 [Pholiota conissans]|uniref:F-box domain-containing protein n=1 Tax=Pholiota conissans TaxID=109636 RepID=A0A9P6D4D2_9AGAR|nr:hypothetical protein BDN70DRAFT_827641 [Pholiota conissans]
MFTLTSLPEDILILILEPLGIHELDALSLTCRTFNTIVNAYGWTNYLRINPRPSYSLAKARNVWSPRKRARYDGLADEAWTRAEFIARPLSRAWAAKLQPVLAISPSRLLVGAGSSISSYTFGAPKPGPCAPPVVFQGTVSLLEHPDRARDITAISMVTDDDVTVIVDVAFHDGAIERVRLFPAGDPPVLSFTRTKLPPMPNADFVENISTDANTMLTLSSNGLARLSPIITATADTPTPPTSLIDLQTRSWTSLLSLQSTPYAAFGTASSTPLTVHALDDGGALSPAPTAILHTKRAAADRLPSSAVYGLARAPPCSPWGASPQILVSGWYDGQVRCYDLRSSSRFSSNTPHTTNGALNGPTHTTTTPLLRPVLTLADRWSYEPIYSLSTGGGSGSHIAAGTARHSVVSFWDARSPSTGWSVHAPGNDPSPVYAVALESARFFGVTQSRVFVYDFGPGVSLERETYPALPLVRGVDGLKQRKGANRATYHVLRYAHDSSGLCGESLV